MNDEVQSIINEVCNKRLGIGQTDNDKWWLHQMWIAQHKIADYLMKNDLQERIDKAIEYIDMIQERRKDLSVEEYHNKWCKLFDYYESQCIMLDLLDILKGSDKE